MLEKWFNDIPVGSENAISRSDLARLWGVSDRIVRRRIERMRCMESPDGTFKRAANTAKPITYARRVLAGIEAGRAAG